MSVHLQVVTGLVIVIFMVNIVMLVQNAMPSARGYQELLEDILNEKDLQRADDADNIFDTALAPENNIRSNRKELKERKEGLALSLKRMRMQNMEMQALVETMAKHSPEVQVGGNNDNVDNENGVFVGNMGPWQRRKNVPDSLSERKNGVKVKNYDEIINNIREDVLNEVKEGNEERESLLNKMDAAGVDINADKNRPIDQMNHGDAHHGNQQQQSDKDIESKHGQNHGEHGGQVGLVINNGGLADLVINEDNRLADQGIQGVNFHIQNPSQNHQQQLRDGGVIEENRKADELPVRDGNELNKNENLRLLNHPQNVNHQPINEENINENMKAHVPPVIGQDNNDGNLIQNNDQLLLLLPQRDIVDKNLAANEPPALQDNVNNNQHNLQALNPPENNYQQPRNGENINGNINANVPFVLRDNDVGENLVVQNPAQNDNQLLLPNKNINGNAPPVLRNNNENLHVLNPPKHNDQLKEDDIDINLKAHMPPVLHENKLKDNENVNLQNLPHNDNQQQLKDGVVDENLNAIVPPVLHENNVLNPPLINNPQAPREQDIDEKFNANVPPVLHENNVFNPPLINNPQAPREQHIDENLHANVPPVLHENVLNPPLIDNPQAPREQHIDENLHANVPPALHQNNVLNPPLDDNPQAPREQHIDENLNLNVNVPPVLNENNVLNPPLINNPQAPREQDIEENLHANVPPVLHENNVLNPPLINNPQAPREQDIDENFNANVPPVLRENNVLNPPRNDIPQAPREQQFDKNLNANHIPPVLHEKNVLIRSLNDNPEAPRYINANVPPVLYDNNALNPQQIEKKLRAPRDDSKELNVDMKGLIPPALRDNNVNDNEVVKLLNPPLNNKSQALRGDSGENMNAHVPPALRENKEHVGEDMDNNENAQALNQVHDQHRAEIKGVEKVKEVVPPVIHQGNEEPNNNEILRFEKNEDKHENAPEVEANRIENQERDIPNAAHQRQGLLVPDDNKLNAVQRPIVNGEQKVDNFDAKKDM